MVILQQIYEGKKAVINNEGNEYEIYNFLFYDENGVRYKGESEDIKFTLKGEVISTIHLEKLFSKAKVKRKENFKSNEIFIKKEDSWNEYFNLYIPLDVFPKVKTSKKITNTISKSKADKYFYKDLIVTTLFNGNQLREGLSLEFTQKKINHIFMRKLWKQEKERMFSIFYEKRERLKTLKERLLVMNNDEEVNEHIKEPLFKTAKEMENILTGKELESILKKRDFLKGQDYDIDYDWYDGSHGHVWQEDDEDELDILIIRQEKNTDEHMVIREHYPTLMQFCYYVILGLEMQLFELEYYSPWSNLFEHNAPEGIQVI